jgi:hypothetical protein
MLTLVSTLAALSADAGGAPAGAGGGPADGSGIVGIAGIWKKIGVTFVMAAAEAHAPPPFLPQPPLTLARKSPEMDSRVVGVELVVICMLGGFAEGVPAVEARPAKGLPPSARLGGVARGMQRWGNRQLVAEAVVMRRGRDRRPSRCRVRVLRRGRLSPNAACKRERDPEHSQGDVS